MKKTIIWLLLTFVAAGCVVWKIFDPSIVKSQRDTEITSNQVASLDKKLLVPGEIFEAGSYICFENVEILYNGDQFMITNNSEQEVILVPNIVNTKEDGTQQWLASPAFYGIDEEGYQQEKEKSGSAVETYYRTNRIRVGETLDMIMELWSTYKEFDIDDDGYYDITFSIHPQESEDMVQVDITDPETPVYKLKA